jgi:peptidoglycan/LPS O-acetylase OafA/YrhL
MIEFVRFALSVLVAEAHLWPIGAPWLAWAAVFGFYTLSGYLIVRVLNERYGFSGYGFGVFALNRFLRLWPAYLVVAAFGFVALRLMPPGSSIGALALPASTHAAIINFTILGIVGIDNQQMTLGLLVPNAWSLSVEIFCYLLLAAYFGRSKQRLLVFAAIGAVAIAISTTRCALSTFDYGAPYCFQNRYTVLQAGFIPFAMGGLLYFWKPSLTPFLARYRMVLFSTLALAVAVTWQVHALQFTIAPYLGSIGMFVLIGSIKGDHAELPLADFFGRASYHLFITHWTIGAILIFGFGMTISTLPVLILSVAISLLFSLALVPMEHRVDALRRRIKAIGAQARTPRSLPSEDVPETQAQVGR